MLYHYIIVILYHLYDCDCDIFQNQSIAFMTLTSLWHLFFVRPGPLQDILSNLHCIQHKKYHSILEF